MAKPRKADIVGVGEIADRFGATPQLAHKWTMSAIFPKPIYTLRSGRLWDWRDVMGWVREHRPDLAEEMAKKKRKAARAKAAA